MTPTREGSIKLFRLAEIQVYLHWSWFLVAVYMINNRAHTYSSVQWNAFEYIGLFAIVLMHEFGHSLACRQVGGQADQIVLWPLGGVAYVNPPQRPGAMLWSIAAGPLVNVVLAPVFGALYFLGPSQGWPDAHPNAFNLLETLMKINFGLLVFNLLPIYPLDGGQILRSLLWFITGRARSLMIATIIGFIGVAGFFFVAWQAGAEGGFSGSAIWMVVLGTFVGMNCWRGFQHARALSRLAKIPRHRGFACRACRTAPVQGPYWMCGQCKQPFDTFANQAYCPNCAAHYEMTQCLDCGTAHPFQAWVVSSPQVVTSTPPPLYPRA